MVSFSLSLKSAFSLPADDFEGRILELKECCMPAANPELLMLLLPLYTGVEVTLAGESGRARSEDREEE